MEPNNNGSLLFHITKRWLQEIHLRRCGGRRARNAQTSSVSDNRQDKSLFDRSSCGPSLTAAVRSDKLLLVFNSFDGATAVCQEHSDKRRQERELGCVRFHHDDFRDERKSFERERESLYRRFLYACTRVSFICFVATVHGEETSGKRFLQSTPE